jgi:hypothetical protein
MVNPATCDTRWLVVTTTTMVGPCGSSEIGEVNNEVWRFESEILEDATRRIRILRGDAQLRYSEVIDGWRHDKSFRDRFTRQLADIPIAAYFWETPPVTAAELHRAFEFVCVDGPSLVRLTPDPTPFEAQFIAPSSPESVVTFPNLGGDAVLVAPVPLAAASAYPHLAAFARRAPPSQQHALWRAVAEALEQQLGDEPVWVSTSGLGVSWLHIRLDSSPKYYQFRPYTRFRPSTVI